MKTILNTQFIRFLLLPLILGFGINCFAQVKAEKRGWSFCQNYNDRRGDQVSVNETRELTMPAADVINVDARRNGGIEIKGENRSDVLIRACIQARGATETEAYAVAGNIKIESGAVIRAAGAGDEQNWSVSYQIAVPLRSNLNLKARNGGISISSVEGEIAFETQNGGVHVSDAAGDVRGKTQNGGVHVSLSGAAWRGGGLDVETINGGVNLEMPNNYAARIETGTVNGGVKSTIDGLVFPSNDRNGGIRSKRIATDLNGGGATVRVITTNGGVTIGDDSSDN